MSKQNATAPAPLKKRELAQIVQNATAAFAQAFDLENEDERLAKADEGQETPAEDKESPSGSAAAPPSPEASAPAPEDTSAAPPAPPAAGGPDAGASPPPADGAGGGEVTVEQIKAEFDQLDVEELKKYFLAAKAALMEKMGGAGQPPGSPDAGASPPASPSPAATPSPSASAAPPPAAASPSPEPPMGKGEFDDKSGKVTEGSMSKSEKEEIFTRLAKAEQAAKDAAAENARLQKALTDKEAAHDAQVAQVAKGIEGLAKKVGLRKSVAAVSALPKPGDDLKKTEDGKIDWKAAPRTAVISKLNDVTRNPKLAKNDRDAINKFVAGNAPVDTVVRFLD